METVSNIDPIMNISPIDGRYNKKTHILKEYFSEFALFKYRLFIEIKYLLELGKQNVISINNNDEKTINNVYINFSKDDVITIKKIEETTQHDIKALEYFIRSKLENNLENEKIINYVHFCLTSQDINSTSYVLSIKQFNNVILIPKLSKILKCLNKIILNNMSLVMMAKTHGQPATPTTLGKEFCVYHERLTNQLNLLLKYDYKTKFGGATGNFNAHKFIFPQKNWISFSNIFINSIGLKRNNFTTQIDHYDNYAQVFDILRRINTILIDFCQDIWLYISNNYFKLKIVESHVGSSTMPHKINPINFENAEGNFYLANSLFQLFSNKLPISRLQRDLTDSTILRNLGVAYGYMYISLCSLETGIEKLEINKPIIDKDLEENYVIIAEAIQYKLKILNVKDSYEKIKNITRNYNSVDELKNNLRTYILSLDIDENEKNNLININPQEYI